MSLTALSNRLGGAGMSTTVADAASEAASMYVTLTTAQMIAPCKSGPEDAETTNRPATHRAVCPENREEPPYSIAILLRPSSDLTRTASV